MSVDDLIADTIAACEGLGIMDHTYFFYTSDHGFQVPGVLFFETGNR
jgi:hypothetical protein